MGLLIKSTRFLQNYAKEGGALYVENPQMILNDSNLINNSADVGGAIFCPYEIELIML